ncbi:GNAT family N-acetyltransferase [Idiomarina tyrosinivorans]|uniref:L-ornithine N(alpha)-acyltransferase n=1 Tax=Idiomarina tyrosinivorans TaxID=1445662 RepID=A0A432ZPC0_9GAMM|nr:GNAT family N-acyltransferase [Idiomarina tyrosinivorans]RUO79734.1 GNAT family N-acetyltransferase [Idiomarina tyrosinivorans]
MISVDNVMQQNLPKLEQRPWLRKPASWVLKHLLHEREIQAFQQQYPALDGIEFVEQVLDFFHFSYSVRDSELERIPSHGRTVIIANHPIGSLDGLALLKLISDIRSDVKILANDWLMQLPPLQPLLLPVNTFAGKTAKQTVNAVAEHLNNDGAVIVFPSGEVSRLRPQGGRDTRWQKGFLRFARSTKAAILPIYINAHNSAWFYGASMVYKPLATALLVKEMFRQQAKSISFRIGEVIPYEAFGQDPAPLPNQVQRFRRHLYRMGRDKSLVFPTLPAVAKPESRQALKNAVEACEWLGETPDGKAIYLYRYQGSSPILREIGRLRELAFRAVGEGTWQRRDLDNYDAYYFQLILWDPNQLEIVGAYRLGDSAKIQAEKGEQGLYSRAFFVYQNAMQQYIENGLELGRSFVQPRYWGKRSLDYLWQGIGAFLRKHPNYRYLFGAVSMSGEFPAPVQDAIVQFYKYYFPTQQLAVMPITPFLLQQENPDYRVSGDYQKDFANLKQLCTDHHVSIPTLYKQYAELCEPGGVQFLGFGLDKAFNSVDGLVLVDIHRLKEKKRRRYLA